MISLICTAVCLVSAMYFSLSNIIEYALVPSNVGNIEWQITFYIWYFLLGLFWWTLLLILIIRLYLTFKPSMYRMSNRLIVLFVIILCLSLVLWVVFVPLLAFERYSISYYLIGSSFVFLYFTGCILAVYFFVSNLHKLS